jgi:hypothetical protein
MSMSWTDRTLGDRPGFRRLPDGQIVVHRAFGRDWAALALSIVGSVAFLLLLIGYVALLAIWMYD